MDRQTEDLGRKALAGNSLSREDGIYLAEHARLLDEGTLEETVTGVLRRPG